MKLFSSLFAAGLRKRAVCFSRQGLGGQKRPRRRLSSLTALASAGRVGARPRPVGMTMSALRRFRTSGTCWRRMPASLSAVMPGRAMTRWRCRKAGALTTSTPSTRRSPRPSNSSGMSSTTSGSPRSAARLRNVRCCWATSGWTIASSLRSASLLPNTRAPSAWRSSTPSFTTPGNAASIGGSASAARRLQAWTAASASYTGTPICRSILAAVDLPMPIEPVSRRSSSNAAERLQASRDQGTRIGLPCRLAAFEVDMAPAPPRPADSAGRWRSSPCRS